MSLRTIVIVLVVVVAFLGGIVWQSQMQKVPAPAPTPAPAAQESAPEASMPPSGGQPVAPPPADASPGLTWKVPANWNSLGEKPMRIATYGIPAAAGDGEGAECAVYYFGPTQGGGVQENIDRWVGQFDHPSSPVRSQGKVAGIDVYRVSVTGGYLAPSGPMMQSSGTRNGYALLGAIAEGPNGRVFFKLTGPARTVKACTREFDDMLRTLRKS